MGYLMTPQWWKTVENTHVPDKYELEGVKSLMHQSDAILLAKYMAICSVKFQVHNGGMQRVVLDIGTYYGASAILMAKTGKFPVVTVDPKPDRLMVSDNFSRHKVHDKVTQLTGFAHQMIWPRNKEIVFMLVDGCHEELNVLHEFYYFGRFVPIGGYVALHDYGKPNWPGVQRVVEEAIAYDGWRIADQEGYMCILEKLYT